MLKKLLLSVSLIALSGTLSSCSYYKNWMGKGTKTEEERMDEAAAKSMDPNPGMNLNDSDGTFLGLPEGRPHMHPNNVRMAPMPQDECVDGRYRSPSDKVQTLGYLKPGYNIPEPKKPYAYKGEHKKPVHKKKPVKKAEVKKDTYNSEAPKVEEKVMPVVPMQEPSAPAPMTPQEPMAPAPMAPAPMPGSVPPVAPMGQVPPPPPPAAGMSAAPATPMAMSPAAAPVVSASPTANTAMQAPQTAPVSRATSLDYQESEIDISTANAAILDQVAGDMKNSPTKSVRIQSYSYATNGNAGEARRNSLQRALKIRKYLIDRDVSAGRISVNAVEDVNNKSNRVEISIEEIKTH